MVRVAAVSREGRRVTKTPRKMQEAPVEDVKFQRREPSPASLDPSDADVSLAF
jgi:hypothetical protein